MHIRAHGVAELLQIGIIATNAGHGLVDPMVNTFVAHSILSEGVGNWQKPLLRPNLCPSWNDPRSGPTTAVRWQNNYSSQRLDPLCWLT